MNKKAFIIFLSIVLGIYFLLNYYVFIRGWKALPDVQTLRIVYIAVCILLFISYILSRFLERTRWVKLSEPFTWIGSFWLLAMFYFFLFIILIDIVRLLDYLFHFLPDINLKAIPAMSIAGIVILALIAGFINARNPIIKRLNIQIPKKASDLKVHLGLGPDGHTASLCAQRSGARCYRQRC